MDKWIFITGISDGIGKSVSIKLAQKGYKVLGISRNKPDYLERYAGSVSWFPFDLSQNSGFDLFEEKVRAFTRTLHGVILNAGINYHSHLHKLDDKKIKEILDVNLTGHVFVIKYLFDLLAPGGQVIFVSSSSVNLPEPNIALYTATKSALESIALSLNVEAASKGLKFKIVRPGGVDTDFWNKAGVPGGTPIGRFVLSPDKVGDDIILAMGENHLFVNSGFLTKVASLLHKFGPKFLVRFSQLRHKVER